LTRSPDGDPIPPDAAAPEAERARAASAHDAPDTPDAPGTESIAVFSLEGRAVPGLYLVGWIASLLGAGTLVISFLATVSVAAPWLFLVGLVVLAVGLVCAAGSQAIERSRRADLAYRGPSPVLAFLVVLVAGLLAQVVVIGPLSAFGLDAGSSAATTVNLLLTTLLYAGVVKLLVVDQGALTWAAMGAVRPDASSLRDLLLGGILAVPLLLLTLVLSSLLARPLGPLTAALPPATSAVDFAWNVLSAVVLAPIGQELFFRGFTTTAWARTNGAWVAIARGALFFGVVYLLTQLDATFAAGASRALHGFLAQLPVGVALGWLFLGRRSLYAAIGLHAAFNLVWVVLLPVMLAR
jgi:membrane protease YdiL (CAAX protease family)